MFSRYFSDYIFFGFKREKKRGGIDPKILYLPSLHYTENRLNKRDNTYLFSTFKN
jgi:hypothetical protein